MRSRAKPKEDAGRRTIRGKTSQSFQACGNRHFCIESVYFQLHRSVTNLHIVNSKLLPSSMSKFEAKWLDDRIDEALLTEVRRVAALFPDTSGRPTIAARE